MRREQPKPKPVHIPVSPSAPDVPLRLAVALCWSDDAEEGLAAISAPAEAAYARHKVISNWQYFGSQVLLAVALILLAWLLFGAPWSGRDPGTIAIFASISIVLIVFPWLAWHIYQYGVGVPLEPMPLGHDADKVIEHVFARLQMESGPCLYSYSAWSGRRVRIDRRIVFSRLRYWLLSQHSSHRRRVTRYPIAIPAPADIFLDSEDVRELISSSTPKRKPGPGRKPKYDYNAAVIALIGNAELLALDLSDKEAARRKVQTMLVEWFRARADASGDAPRTDMVTDLAGKIVARLQELQHEAKKSS